MKNGRMSDARLSGHPSGVIRGLWLDGEHPVTRNMTHKMAAAGWSTASFWTRLEGNCDRGQDRLRREVAAA